MQFESVVWFVIRQKSDRAFACEKPIANADAWMIHESRTDMHFANLEIHGLKLFDFDLSWQIVERDRKKRRRHLTFKDLAQAAAGSIVAKNLDLVFVVVRRHEKRKALDVVPMNMGNEQAEINRAGTEFAFESEA